MPKRGNPNIMNIPHRGRVNTADEAFFFKVNNIYRVTRDRYNLLILKVITSEESGKKYAACKGFYSTMGGVCKGLRGLSETDPQTIKAFSERVKDIEIEHINGRLVIKAPPDMVFDPRDLPDDPNDKLKEDGDNSGIDAEENDQ